MQSSGVWDSMHLHLNINRSDTFNGHAQNTALTICGQGFKGARYSNHPITTNFIANQFSALPQVLKLQVRFSKPKLHVRLVLKKWAWHISGKLPIFDVQIWDQIFKKALCRRVDITKRKLHAEKELIRTNYSRLMRSYGLLPEMVPE